VNTFSASASPPLGGGAPNTIAAGNAIDQLNNVTITNANLTASEIPALNYFPSTSTVSVSYGGAGTTNTPTFGQLLLGNGNGSYNFVATSSLGILSGSSLLSSANSWTGLNVFSTGASTTKFSNFGTAYFGGTATTTIDSAGDLTVAGSFAANGNVTIGNATSTNFFATTASSTNLSAIYATTTSLFVKSASFSTATIGAATSTNFFSATASSTNLFAQAASVGSLALSSSLGVGSGGTGWSNIAAGAILYGNGSSALATTSAGTAGYVLAYLYGVPTWTATTTLANISGTLSVSSGGTGSTTLSGLLVGNGTSALKSATVSSILARRHRRT
jgi:hypothetical protein